MTESSGKLYLVATPLGNLEDITQRALRTLGEVDLIAAEDTRHTLKLLNYFQIKKPMLSCYQHNERSRGLQIVERIRAGANVALVSDAGMPGISDPGNWLVAEAIKSGITVVPIPGASAVITALAASGLDTGSFQFEGFLPRKTTEQAAKLILMADFKGTLVLYESPHRVVATLKNVLAVLGDRQVVLARELTKIHEEFIRGAISQILPKLESEKPKGEFTILITGVAQNVKNLQNSTKETQFDINVANIPAGSSLRNELKMIAKKTGKTTKEVYRQYLNEKNKEKE